MMHYAGRPTSKRRSFLNQGRKLPFLSAPGDLHETEMWLVFPVRVRLAALHEVRRGLEKKTSKETSKGAGSLDEYLIFLPPDASFKGCGVRTSLVKGFVL
jgi:hypothetical protein